MRFMSMMRTTRRVSAAYNVHGGSQQDRDAQDKGSEGRARIPGNQGLRHAPRLSVLPLPSPRRFAVSRTPSPSPRDLRGENRECGRRRSSRQQWKRSAAPLARGRSSDGDARVGVPPPAAHLASSAFGGRPARSPAHASRGGPPQGCRRLSSPQGRCKRSLRECTNAKRLSID